MTAWTIVSVYALGYAITWRRLTRWFVYVEFEDDPGYAAVAVGLGTLFTVFWPPIALGWAVRRAFGSRSILRTLLGEPPVARAPEGR